MRVVDAAYLGESEDVVNKEQHILSLLVSEVLSHGQTGQGNSGSGTGGLVHLSVDKGDLGLSLELDNTALNHLVVEIVTLSGPLSHSREHRVTSVSLGHVVDQLHNQHSLAHTGTTEQTWRRVLGDSHKLRDEIV